MRNVNFASTLTTASGAIANGDKIDSNQLVSGSFQIMSDQTDTVGTFKIQASNDPCAYGNLALDFTPSNWTDIPSATASVSASGTGLILLSSMAYRWVRPVFSHTTGASGHLTIEFNAMGV